MDSKLQQYIDELLVIALEGHADEQQLDELNHLIRTNPEAQEYCSYYLALSSKLHLSDKLALPFVSQDINEYKEYLQSLKELEQLENSAPEVIIENTLQAESQKEIKEPRFNVSNRFAKVFNRVVAAAALIFIVFIIYANVFPPQYSVQVATVLDQIDVNWSKGSARLENNDTLLSNQAPYCIERGTIKIAYNQGVDVVIEGPAKFEFERAGIFLEYGRLYSLVSKSGRGFTINSPYARYVDLGTEFGVEVDSSGISELHVLKGKVQLYAGLDDEEKESRTVPEGAAIRFDANNGRLDNIVINKNAFARELDSNSGVIWRGQNYIDLADIIGGGNGYGNGKIQNAIDPLTGKMRTWELTSENTGNHNYNLVNQSKYIDGVFVPDGSDGPVKVTSMDNTWDCPATSNAFKYPVVNSLQIPNDLSQFEFYTGDAPKEDIILEKALKTSAVRSMSIKSPDYRYNVDDKNIFMHSNLGITFNLWEIRKTLPDGNRVKRFKSVFGLSEIALDTKSLDVWVLIDGNPVCVKKDLDSSMSIDIDIELADDSDFLTLAVTEGSDQFKHYNDWGVFINPRLIIE